MTSTPCISLDSATVGFEIACKGASSVVQTAGRLRLDPRRGDKARCSGTRAAVVELLATSQASLIDRFRARRREMIEHGVHHPERDIAGADVEAFVVDAVERRTRLPTARPESLIVPIEREASECGGGVYRRLLSVLGE